MVIFYFIFIFFFWPTLVLSASVFLSLLPNANFFPGFVHGLKPPIFHQHAAAH